MSDSSQPPHHDLFHVADTDPTETQEWLDSLTQIVRNHGDSRARHLLSALLRRAAELKVDFPSTVTTPYVNTIDAADEPWFPGDDALERRIRSFIRWNAVAMVVRANVRSEGIGGHLSTFASSATLYEVGFNHFFRGKDDGGLGDRIYIQGHAAPGIYARAFLEGRLNEDDLDHFRFEAGRPGKGLSSYPHPRLMPDFWEFPTVSMGLGPLCSIYQARFDKYLLNRRIADTTPATTWCFVGDGETDEPETLAAIGLAGREQLGNLIWVVNCNLQRLDGPVRGNYKIIQELEGYFRGAGWNVLKVIWGSEWDALLERDTEGALVDKMEQTCDGEYQRWAIADEEEIRERFFGPEPQLRKIIEGYDNDYIRRLRRGGHDTKKIFAAYKAAAAENLRPTVVLAKTIKGWTLGPSVEARNATHQIKKLNHDEMRSLRSTLHLDDVIPESALEADVPPYVKPHEGSPEHTYLMSTRQRLGGAVPKRIALRSNMPNSALPPVPTKPFQELNAGSGKQEVSTTMAFTRLLRELVKDDQIGKYLVPIIADEGRTFGMDYLFSDKHIYSPVGQRYEPVDAGMLLSYKESAQGQILQEGITEAGAMASFIAAGTARANTGVPMVPFFPFYSMFGFQRIGDLIWAATDARARGFLLGATAGRTALNGEGLQHQDGHSPVLAATNPAVVSYDPAYAYELGTIIKVGLADMVSSKPRDLIHYITVYNENYQMPARPEGLSDEAIISGMYRLSTHNATNPTVPDTTVSILFSGVACRAATEAAELLSNEYQINCELFSVTSWSQLRNQALRAQGKSEDSLIDQHLGNTTGPVIAITDFSTQVPDLIARFIKRPYIALGTDGFGRSDTREALRNHFGVSTSHLVAAAVAAVSNEAG